MNDKAWLQSLLKPLASCPYCQSSEKRLLYQFDILHIYKCPKCTLIYLNPCLMPQEQMMIFSSPELLKRLNQFLADYHDDSAWETPQTLSIYRNTVKTLSKIYPQKGRLLDVGCGKGAFLRVAQEEGWHAHGLEPNFSANKGLFEKFKISMYECDFFDIRVPENDFDVVCLWDLIEHTPNPMAWMERCRALLKPGGLVLMATPNHRSFLDITAHLAYVLSFKQFRYPLQKLYTPDHTLYLTDSTLEKLFEDSRFEVMKTIKVNSDLSRYTMKPWFRIFANLLLQIASFLGLQNRVIMIGNK